MILQSPLNVPGKSGQKVAFVGRGTLQKNLRWTQTGPLQGPRYTAHVSSRSLGKSSIETQ